MRRDATADASRRPAPSAHDTAEEHAQWALLRRVLCEPHDPDRKPTPVRAQANHAKSHKIHLLLLPPLLLQLPLP